ncbi:MAG: GrpB family protein [Propionibacteriales bacterium]|nr:GrpB family protein [Propionibacteriales bacterium]
MRVAVTPYDPSWPITFETIRTHLVAALVDVPILAIEHVGSTSVPGLAAKPILDIDVVVERPALEDAIAALVAAGYGHEGDKGVPDRHFMRASPIGEYAEVDRHVYVCVEGSLSLRNHLAVRDTLRADDVLRDAYAAVKLDLAEQDVESIDEYIDGKNDILQRILGKAGLADDEREQILGVNTAG